MLRTAQASILIVNMHEPPNTSPPEVDRFSAGVARGKAVWQVCLLPSACVSITFRGMKKEERVVAVPARW